MSTPPTSEKICSTTSNSSRSGSSSSGRASWRPTYELIKEAGLVLLGVSLGIAITKFGQDGSVPLALGCAIIAQGVLQVMPFGQNRSSETVGGKRDSPIPGHLFNYNIKVDGILGAKYRLIAHESTLGKFSYLDTEYYIVFIGGLSDSIYSMAWIPEFSAGVHSDLSKSGNWSVLTISLSSSGMGFGHQSLRKDVKELNGLLEHLSDNRPRLKGVVFVGHSTGCQDLAELTKFNTSVGDKFKHLVKAVVLQAPVSDREATLWIMKQRATENANKITKHNPRGESYDVLFDRSQKEFNANIDHARRLIDEGRQDAMMPRSAFWAPITAYRYFSLHGTDGDDDFFSISFTNAKLKEKLGHIDIPALFVWSAADQYVDPAHHQCIEKHLELMKSSVSSRCPRCDYAIIAKADHGLKVPHQALSDFVQSFLSFVTGLS